MKRIIAALLLLAMFACSKTTSGIDVYYVGDLTSPFQTVTLKIKESDFKSIANAVMTPPQNSNLSTAFVNTECEGVVLDGSDLTVQLSLGYMNLTGLERTMANACMVLTFTALPHVERVRIEVDGKPETDFLAADDFLLDDTVQPEVAEFEIYYVDTELETLVSETRRFVVREGESVERCLFDELLKTDIESSLVPVIPQKTRLVGSDISDGTLTLVLSQDFVDFMPENNRIALLSINGLTNAFSSVEGVERIRIQIQYSQGNRQLTSYGETELPEYLTPGTQ